MLSRGLFDAIVNLQDLLVTESNRRRRRRERFGAIPADNTIACISSLSCGDRTGGELLLCGDTTGVTYPLA